MFGSPVVTHPVCDLDLHERIREAKRDSIARSVGGRRRRSRRRRPIVVDADVFARTGEDVAHAFRF